MIPLGLCAVLFLGGLSVARYYGSFLIRCWRASEGSCTVVIEHVQSGTQTKVHSVTEALVWIETQYREWKRTGSSEQSHSGVHEEEVATDE
jgi:hypothetical protein